VVFLRFFLNIGKGMGYRESVASALRKNISNHSLFIIFYLLFIAIQIKKLLQNKIFHFSILLFHFLISIIIYLFFKMVNSTLDEQCNVMGRSLPNTL
jgi:4-amino-4-deoxy-L-arabinose transferase-like glycosyltransferase